LSQSLVAENEEVLAGRRVAVPKRRQFAVASADAALLDAEQDLVGAAKGRLGAVPHDDFPALIIETG
jgi:hypothetical protein